MPKCPFEPFEDVEEALKALENQLTDLAAETEEKHPGSGAAISDPAEAYIQRARLALEENDTELACVRLIMARNYFAVAQGDLVILDQMESDLRHTLGELSK